MNSYIVYITSTPLRRKIHLFHFCGFGRSFCRDFVLMLFSLYSFFPEHLNKILMTDKETASPIPSRFVVTPAVQASDVTCLMSCGCNY